MNKTAKCFCGSIVEFSQCCQPIIEGNQDPVSAEQLMRSRYSAYCIQAADFLVQTTHKSTRKFHKKSDILDWSKSNSWIKLEIINSTERIVEFKAFYVDAHLEAQTHHEKSTFIFDKGSCYYVDGIFF